MANPTDKIKASTQGHLDIDDITEDLIVLKNGWVAMVLSTTAVNFDILSEAEQDATIYAYGALLNSLTFPLQVLIRSKKADITAYYQHLVEAERNQPNPDLKIQIQKYKEFVQSTVQQKTILDKRFYLVVHFSSLEMGVKSFKKTDTSNFKSKASLIADAKAALSPKREHIVKQTARLGLFSKQLTTQELIELFYDIYNPAPTGTQRVILDAESYTAPLVEPDLETPTPAPTEPAVLQPKVESVVQDPLKIEPLTINTQDMGNRNEGAPLVAPIPSLVHEQPGGVSVPNLNTPIMPVAPISLQSTPPAQAQQPTPASTADLNQDAALKSLQDAMKRAASMAQDTGANVNTNPK